MSFYKKVSRQFGRLEVRTMFTNIYTKNIDNLEGKVYYCSWRTEVQLLYAAWCRRVASISLTRPPVLLTNKTKRNNLVKWCACVSACVHVWERVGYSNKKKYFTYCLFNRKKEKNYFFCVLVSATRRGEVWKDFFT